MDLLEDSTFAITVVPPHSASFQARINQRFDAVDRKIDRHFTPHPH